MYRFFESIAIIDGVPRNLFYHQSRINKTFKQFYPNNEPLHLEYLLFNHKMTPGKKVKCKFSYNEKDYKFLNIDYIPKKYNSFKLVTDNAITYSYKSVDRSMLNKLIENVTPDQQIIVIKDNQITDTNYSNIIFYDGHRWLTPLNPLLKGTMRASLIAEIKIYEEIIYVEHLRSFTGFKMINALNAPEETLEYSIDTIIR